MKKILHTLILLILTGSLFGQQDDTTKYVKYPGIYGLQYPRLWGTKVLRIPEDTIYTKTGIARKGSVLYVGNGTLWTAVGGGGGSTLFALSGTNTATGEVIGELDGNVLRVQQGLSDFLTIDPTENNELVLFQAYNTTGNNVSGGNFSTSDVQAAFTWFANFNGGEKLSSIDAFVNSSTSTLTYTADEHEMVFDDEFEIVKDGQLWFYLQAEPGGEYVAINGVSSEIEGASTSLFLRSNTDDGFKFQLVSFDGTNTIDLTGNAGSQTITLTAANGVLIPNYIAGASTDSVLTWDSGTGTVRMRDASSFGGGSTLFALTGTNTATGGVIGELDGNTLQVQNGGNDYVSINPTTFNNTIQATDGSSLSQIELIGNSGATTHVAVTSNDGTGLSFFNLNTDGFNGYNFQLSTSDGIATSVNLTGDGIENTMSLKADTIILHSTLSGATSGMVWTLQDPTTGSGYWGASGISGITADNGLTANTDTNVQLGGTLLQNTSIDLDDFNVEFKNGSDSYFAIGNDDGSYIISDNIEIVQLNSTNNFVASVGGPGGNLIEITTVLTSLQINPESTNTVETVTRITRTSPGTSANGIGGSLDFYIQDDSQSATSNQLISKWTDVTDATRTSQLIITGVNSGTTADKLVINGDGSMYGTGLHNTGTPTGTTTQYIASGTYTPTLTSVANVGASTAYLCQWMRVGNVVTVSGKMDIDATTTLTITQLGISLPIASAFTNARDCGGTGNASLIAGSDGAISADAANDRAQIDFIPVSTTNDSFFFTFTYLIL